MTATKRSNLPASTTESQKPSTPSSSSSQDARARRSARALREGLLVLLENKPFDQITVRDICTQSGVHYATFFRHHSAKESLLDEIAKKQIEHLIELTMAIRAAEDYEAGFRSLCEYVEEHRSLWSTLLNGGAGGAMREEWLSQSQKVAAAEAPVHSWLPPDLGAICAATLIAETLAWWVRQPAGAYRVGEVAGILHRLLTTSLMASE